MLTRPEIRRGSDVSFKILLRDQDGRPYDLTGLTFLKLRLPKENTGSVEVDSSTIPAVKASSTVEIDGEDVLFEAVTPGVLGNSISLTFNGSDDISDVVAAWNLANPSNTVTFSGIVGTTVPDASTVDLDQGTAAYTKISTNPILALGEIYIILTEADTSQLKLGRGQAIELTVDKGNIPAGARKIVLLRDAINVEEKFF